MMYRRVATLAIAFGCLTASAARGDTGDQSKSSESTEEQRRAAHVEFVDGVAAFDRGAYPEALKRFRRAQELSPNQAVQVPIATCLERMLRFQEALETWKAVATAEGADEETHAKAGVAIARLEAIVGTLVVTGVRSNAPVLIDGVQRCEIPCRVRVDPGAHELVVTGAAKPHRQHVELGRGQIMRVEIPAFDEPQSPPPEPLPPTAPGFPTALGYVGGGLAILAAGGAIGFGLHAKALHGDYFAAPTTELRSDGLLARDVSNGLTVVAAVGAAIVAVDLILWAVGDDPPTHRPGPDGVAIRF